MKILLTILLSIMVELSADEIQRVESMLSDISKLENKQDFTQKEKNYINKINNLENQLKITKNRVKTKEIKKVKIKENNITCLTNQKLEEKNPFPKLKMKKEYQDTKSDITFFKASSFKLIKEAKIYDGVEANIVATWEDKTSFTSNQRDNQWIKITGYFVDKQWKPTEKEMWIKSVNVVNKSKALK